MTTSDQMTEYETEPVRGLPAPLPAGETLLWQGGPAWWPLARSAFHFDKIADLFRPDDRVAHRDLAERRGDLP